MSVSATTTFFSADVGTHCIVIHFNIFNISNFKRKVNIGCFSVATDQPHHQKQQGCHTYRFFISSHSFVTFRLNSLLIKFYHNHQKLILLFMELFIWSLRHNPASFSPMTSHRSAGIRETGSSNMSAVASAVYPFDAFNNLLYNFRSAFSPC